jgi:hypothetical protein
MVTLVDCQQFGTRPYQPRATLLGMGTRSPFWNILNWRFYLIFTSFLYLSASFLSVSFYFFLFYSDEKHTQEKEWGVDCRCGNGENTNTTNKQTTTFYKKERGFTHTHTNTHTHIKEGGGNELRILSSRFHYTNWRRYTNNPTGSIIKKFITFFFGCFFFLFLLSTDT